MKQPLAYIHPGAKIAPSVVIDPFVTIENNVEIGEGTRIGSNVTIMEGARIGKNCTIFPGAVISGTPQDLKFKGEETLAIIVDPGMINDSEINVIDEFITKNNLSLTHLINTHMHIDHAFGVSYIKDKYKELGRITEYRKVCRIIRNKKDVLKIYHASREKIKLKGRLEND